MTSVSQLGYLGLRSRTSTHGKASPRRFWESRVWAATNNGALMFRIDEYQYRFVLEQGAKDDLDVIGWQVEDERSPSAVADQLTRRGLR